jgi:hypothetical protein
VILAARQIYAIACLKIKNLNEFQWKLLKGSRITEVEGNPKALSNASWLAALPSCRRIDDSSKVSMVSHHVKKVDPQQQRSTIHQFRPWSHPSPHQSQRNSYIPLFSSCFSRHYGYTKCRIQSIRHPSVHRLSSRWPHQLDLLDQLDTEYTRINNLGRWTRKEDLQILALTTSLQTLQNQFSSLHGCYMALIASKDTPSHQLQLRTPQN